MPSHKRPGVTKANATPYRSSSCLIGTHRQCAHSSPAVAPVGVPVVYEACDCPCHPAVAPIAPGEVTQ